MDNKKKCTHLVLCILCRRKCTVSNGGGSIDEWLDQFDIFSIYEVLPEIFALLGTNLVTDFESKKLKKVVGR